LEIGDRRRMILLINICKEKLHYFEFVKPIEDILIKNDLKYFVKDYDKLEENDLKKPDKIIICGTSLNDNLFLENVDKFKWVKDYKKPIYGICGGMQIIGLIFNGKLKEKIEIGLNKITFHSKFYDSEGVREVYQLHNNYIEFSGQFNVMAKNDIVQAIKHNRKSIYGVLFHPEVRNKWMIERFCSL